MIAEFNAVSVACRILIAAVMGGCIGFERGQHGRAAGLRTHILVCIGAALTALCGLYGALVMSFNNDPMRISAQVISGIGFLGAGTILTRSDSRVTGLTTAAGLWTTACIGITIGLGFYCAAIVAFLIVMISITALTRLEWAQKRNVTSTCYLEVNDAAYVNGLCDFIAGYGGHVQVISAKSGIENHVGLLYSLPEKADDHGLVERIRKMDGVVILVPQS